MISANLSGRIKRMAYYLVFLIIVVTRAYLSATVVFNVKRIDLKEDHFWSLKAECVCTKIRPLRGMAAEAALSAISKLMRGNWHTLPRWFHIRTAHVVRRAVAATRCCTTAQCFEPFPEQICCSYGSDWDSTI